MRYRCIRNCFLGGRFWRENEETELVSVAESPHFICLDGYPVSNDEAELEDIDVKDGDSDEFELTPESGADGKPAGDPGAGSGSETLDHPGVSGDLEQSSGSGVATGDVTSSVGGAATPSAGGDATSSVGGAATSDDNSQAAATDTNILKGNKRSKSGTKS